MYYVFVYGSLKKGKGNDRLLTKAKFITEAVMTGHYKMVSFGNFPGVILVNDPPMRNVLGEVYEIDDKTLHNLDVLEGNGHFYQRTLVTVRSTEKGRNDFYEVYCYLLMDGYEDKKLPEVKLNKENTYVW